MLVSLTRPVHILPVGLVQVSLVELMFVTSNTALVILALKSSVIEKIKSLVRLAHTSPVGLVQVPLVRLVYTNDAN